MPPLCLSQPRRALALHLKRALAATPLALGLVAALYAGGARAQGPVPPLATAGRAPGLYVQVIDGLINVTNPAGTSNFAAGQFGFTPSVTQPPVVLPTNPGIPFSPPPAFNSSVAASNSGSLAKSNAVDCVVR